MRVKIISARAKYEKQYPGKSKTWKTEAFADIGNKYNKSKLTNILAFGDSMIEMEAADLLGKSFLEAFVKTVKFREHPRLDELIKQIELVNQNLDFMFKMVKNQMIKLEKKK